MPDSCKILVWNHIVGDTITDIRDSQEYCITKLGEFWWLTQNLNFNAAPGSYYYDNDSSTNASPYARLYLWQEALLTCPAGWHLPDTSEWQNMINFIDDSATAGGLLKAIGTGFWKDPNTGASDLVGFSAYPGGKRSSGDTFGNIQTDTWFWTSNPGSSGAYAYHLSYDTALIEVNEMHQLDALSVRCVRDTVIISKSDVKCFSDNDGSVDLDVYFGKPPLTFNWSNGSDTKDLSGLAPGTYDLIITDAIDSAYRLSVEITGPGEIEVNLTAISICGPGNTGSVSSIVTGGVGNFIYAWSGGQQTSNIDNLSPGKYFLTATDADGCIQSDSIEVIRYNEAFTVSISATNEGYLCTPVTLDAGNGLTSYLWSTGETASQITKNDPGIYSITVSNETNCIARDTFNVKPAPSLSTPSICIVTVDLATGKNMIVWEKTSSDAIDYYNIYREGTSQGSYDLIGTVPYSNLSIFKDIVSSPEEQQFIYSISAVDICGTETELASWHKTLFLQYVFGNLNWSEYKIQNGEINFLTYEIYRGSETENLGKIKDVSSSFNLWTDIEPLAKQNKYYYRIGGIKPYPCYPTGSKKESLEPISASISNLINNGIISSAGTEVNLENLRIYPNPASAQVRIDFPNPENKKCYINLIDLDGRLIRSSGPLTGNQTILNLNEVPKGVYIIEVWAEKIYREKLNIE